MTERAAEEQAQSGRGGQDALPPNLIPKEDMRAAALVAVIAIMSFLAVWALLAAHFIRSSAAAWGAGAAREALVQIMPAQGRDMAQAQSAAAAVARSFAGVAAARIVTQAETQALLAPWLGAKADIAALPVPGLVALELDSANPPDYAGLAAALAQKAPGARLEHRQIWAEQLAKTARILLGGALSALALILAALALAVMFATRSALAGTLHIIEVLHFIGAEERFIIRRFDAHFFRAGLKGAALGCLPACLLAFVLGWAALPARAESGGSEMAALFGRLAPDWALAAELIGLMLITAATAMAAGHCTVMRFLRFLDKKSSAYFPSA